MERIDGKEEGNMKVDESGDGFNDEDLFLTQLDTKLITDRDWPIGTWRGDSK
jgi:hypothetical protein